MLTVKPGVSGQPSTFNETKHVNLKSRQTNASILNCEKQVEES